MASSRTAAANLHICCRTGIVRESLLCLSMRARESRAVDTRHHLHRVHALCEAVYGSVRRTNWCAQLIVPSRPEGHRRPPGQSVEAHKRVSDTLAGGRPDHE